jgi:hypothetical protein
MVKTHDAQNAIHPLLAGKQVPVTHTGVFGCSTKRPEKSEQREAADRKIKATPIHLKKIDAAGVKNCVRVRPAR